MTQWWHNAVVYQIYPRSFADSNGDGVGDLRGITSRVDYLASLNIDAVWLSPFYPSQLADGGYDVDDYCDVDPRLGTLADFDELVDALHAAGLRVIIDVVPNHTSNLHVWFQQALAAGPGSPERDRYIFRDGRGPAGDEPPNDWQSGFGGSIWQRVDDGQWYFHFFAREQPDLNWDNPEVRAMMLDVLRFWSDRGVDGFRVDVASGLVKDHSRFGLPWSQVGMICPDDGNHPLWDSDRLPEIYAEWQGLLSSYDPPRMAVAEAPVGPTRRARYAAALGQAFNFQMQDANWNADSLRTAIDAGLADLATCGSTTWLLGCHDSPRVASRFGLPVAEGEKSQLIARQWLRANGQAPAVDTGLGRRRALAAAEALTVLPGSMYIYQGDELGLPEVADLPDEVLQDPIAFRNRDTEKGRDGCRVPLPWTPGGPSFGFSEGPAHLPQPVWFADYAVSVQDADPESFLNHYRRALAARRSIDPDAPFAWLDAPHGVLKFRRGEREIEIDFR